MTPNRNTAPPSERDAWRGFWRNMRDDMDLETRADLLRQCRRGGTIVINCRVTTSTKPA